MDTTNAVAALSELSEATPMVAGIEALPEDPSEPNIVAEAAEEVGEEGSNDQQEERVRDIGGESEEDEQEAAAGMFLGWIYTGEACSACSKRGAKCFPAVHGNKCGGCQLRKVAGCDGSEYGLCSARMSRLTLQ